MGKTEKKTDAQLNVSKQLAQTRDLLASASKGTGMSRCVKLLDRCIKNIVKDEQAADGEN